MNTQPPLATSPTPPSRLSRNARIAAVALGGSIATLLLVVAVSFLRAADDGLAAAPSPSRSPAPSLVANPTRAPSPSPVAPASPTPPGAPGATPTPSPPTETVSFPVRGYASSVLMTPGPSGGLYVAAPADDGTVALSLVGTDGVVAPGWPIRLASGCTALLTASDSTLRAICDGTPDGEGLQAPVTRIFGFDSGGRPLRGWPADVDGSMYEWGAPMAHIDGVDLTLVVRVYQGDDVPEGTPESVQLVRVDGTGKIQVSDPIEFACCDIGVVPGPGIAYMLNRDYFGDGSTQVTARDVDGIRWQTSIDSVVSNPAFDDEGNAYFSGWRVDSRTNQVVVIDPTGNVTLATPDLPIEVAFGYDGAGPEYPAAPLVAGDGSFAVYSNVDGSSILAFDRQGHPRAGWPFNSALRIAEHGFCGSGETGCGTFHVRPRFGKDGTLYIAYQPGDPDAGQLEVGSLMPVRRDSTVPPRWPVMLRKDGAMFWDLVVGNDGGVWALAAEPEGTERYSATLLSVAPDKTVRGRITIVEPPRAR
ncbi:MAG TPA: hypothetical protein VFV72_01195 [Candidatus Limnocylindrales bacterium]|nr:hypothetical protein [Candidatus Limnocylindrales bacterium]